MKKLKYLLLTLCIMTIGFVYVAPNVGAVDVFNTCSDPKNSGTVVCGGTSETISGYIKTGVNILLYILAAVSVVMIILSGIFYTTSGGNAGTVTKAKDTLLYSVVGLIVAILAYSIVNFVLTNFK